MGALMDPVYDDPRCGDDLTPQEWREIEEKLERALILLLLELPYLGSMVAAMASDRVWVRRRGDIREGEEFRTLATDGRRLYLWPPFVLHVPAPFLAGALLHELMHNLLLHPLRAMGFEPSLANQAMDYCVNLMVNDAAVAHRRIDSQRRGEERSQPVDPAMYRDLAWYIPVDEDFCVDERFRDERGEPMVWERIYAILESERPPARLLDSHATWSPADRPADDDGRVNRERFDPETVRRWLQAAEQFRHARSTGAVPAGFLRRIDEWLHPPLPWHRMLQAYLRTAPGDFGWAPGDLRFPDPMPYWVDEPALDWITFGFDLSGSMTDEEIAASVENARSILRSFPNTRGRAYFWDAEVHDACDLDDFDGAVRRGVSGGGGTSALPQFAALDDDGLLDRTRVHVVFTDGLLDFDEIDPDALPCDVLWVLTQDGIDVPDHHRYRATRLES